MNHKPGLLVVISSPSGGGKTTIIKRILKRIPNFQYSISVTTRPKRRGEIEGKDYFFSSKEEFKTKINQGEFLEWEQVHGNYYGTPKKIIDEWLSQGKTVFLDIDVKGALNIEKIYPKNSVLIFLNPPSIEHLRKRLQKRASDNSVEIDKRLEIAEKEIAFSNLFNYVVTNDDLNKTEREVIDIIKENQERKVA